MFSGDSDRLQLSRSQFILLFDEWLQSYLEEAREAHATLNLVLKSQEYSLLSGGKRFRPFLAYLVFRLFSSDLNKIKNLCLALEMIHTYSLIHDDLPCMDNDDLRRGKPTNHKVFSEDISLLAGDGLLTDAFFLLSSDECIQPIVKLALINFISKKIGSVGMVLGQALDIKADHKVNFAELKRIHTLKTANLIQASAVGAALVAEVSSADVHNIAEFSYHLGMAFQIKDDLLDAKDKEQDLKSYLSLLGLEKTTAELKQHSQFAKNHLGLLKRENIDVLFELIDFNFKRNS